MTPETTFTLSVSSSLIALAEKDVWLQNTIQALGELKMGSAIGIGLDLIGVGLGVVALYCRYKGNEQSVEQVPTQHLHSPSG